MPELNPDHLKSVIEIINEGPFFQAYVDDIEMLVGPN